MTPQEYQSQTLKLIEEAIATFDKQMPEVEKQVYRNLLNLIKDLEIKNGITVNSIENLKKIGKIQSAINGAVLNKKYLDAVQNFVNVFNKIADLQRKYFKSNFDDPIPEDKLKEITKLAKEAMVRKLTGPGIDANVSIKIEDILRNNITQGESFASLMTQVQQFVNTTGVDMSKITAYTQTVATDSINQYNAQYHELVTFDLGLQWRMYVGSNIATTREWCEFMTKKKYVHESELPTVLKGLIDGHQCRINPKTKLWYGAIEGTNTSNVAVWRGGHRCGHQFISVSKAVVPKALRDKFKQ